MQSTKFNRVDLVLAIVALLFGFYFTTHNTISVTSENPDVAAFVAHTSTGGPPATAPDTVSQVDVQPLTGYGNQASSPASGLQPTITTLYSDLLEHLSLGGTALVVAPHFFDELLLSDGYTLGINFNTGQDGQTDMSCGRFLDGRNQDGSFNTANDTFECANAHIGNPDAGYTFAVRAADMERLFSYGAYAVIASPQSPYLYQPPISP